MRVILIKLNVCDDEWRATDCRAPASPATTLSNRIVIITFDTKPLQDKWLHSRQVYVTEAFQRKFWVDCVILLIYVSSSLLFYFLYLVCCHTSVEEIMKDRRYYCRMAFHTSPSCYQIRSNIIKNLFSCW